MSQSFDSEITSLDKRNGFIKFISWIRYQFQRNALYIWTSIWILFVIFFGPIIIYQCTSHIDTNYSIIVVWAIAYFFLGALFGCILGVPKGVSKPQIETPAIKSDESKIKDQKIVEQTSDSQNITAKITYNRGNTNLTDISDWLTKIIIGAGLVQLNQIPGFIMKVSSKMAQGIHLPGVPNAQILCAGVIIYYVCFGLIAGYFVMRSILLDLLD